jgi:SAM-dependent methyltransferase
VSGASAAIAAGYAACPACGSPEVAAARRIPDHEYGIAFEAEYARCGRCGSEYQMPMPASEQLAAWYPPQYHSMQGRGWLGRLRHGVRYRRVRKLLRGDGALLDYGCGDGSFLDFAAEQGESRPLVGFEIAGQARVVERRDARIQLIYGSLDDLLARAPECAVITMNHVIEHLPDPLAVIRQLVGRLRPGGCFEGQTPAAGCLEQRVFGHFWSGYHAPRHTVVFSPTGLREILARAGLAEVRVAGAFNPAGLALSLASLPQGAAPGVLPRSGPRWLVTLAAAAALAPIDLACGAPAVVDFDARKPEPA